MARGGFITFSLLSFLVAPALADPASVDLRQFNPPVDPEASLSLETTSTPGAGNWNVGLYSSYAYRLLVLTDNQEKELSVPIAHQSSVDLVFGTGLGKRFAMGLVLPAVVYQTGSEESLGGVVVPQTSLGDPIVEGKVTLVPRGPLGGFGLAAITRAGVPVGSPNSGVGDHGWVGQISLLSELDLVAANLRAEAGFRARGKHAVLAGDEFGHTIPFALGVSVRPQVLGWDSKGRWQWFLETRGHLAVAPEFGRQKSSPIALGLGARYNLGKDVSLLAGAELPLSDAVGVPALRGVLGLSYAPRFYDADSDGIADDVDDCPEGMPEDFDGFEDDDGCPDEDNDLDGVPDADDQCAKSEEDQDGTADDDGCLDEDNDRDGVLDTEDACPLAAGAPSKSKKWNGCPPKDTDQDGVLDDVDKCLTRPEDRDGVRDDDGCPDLDDDGDGVREPSDACPKERGARRMIAALNGCPDPDSDNDTYFGVHGDELLPAELSELSPETTGAPRDACPLEAEDFDGDHDEDGCPDLPNPAKATELVHIELTATEGLVSFTRPPVPSRQSPWPETRAQWELWRALSRELRLHPDWTARVTVIPKSESPEDQSQSQQQAARLCSAIDLLTLRSGSATHAAHAPSADAATVEKPKAPPPSTAVTVRVTWPATRRGPRKPITAPTRIPPPAEPASPETQPQPGEAPAPETQPQPGEAPAPDAPASAKAETKPRKTALPPPLHMPRDSLAPPRPASVLPRNRIPQ